MLYPIVNMSVYKSDFWGVLQHFGDDESAIVSLNLAISLREVLVVKTFLIPRILQTCWKNREVNCLSLSDKNMCGGP